jgi:hypothetical protein
MTGVLKVGEFKFSDVATVRLCLHRIFTLQAFSTSLWIFRNAKFVSRPVLAGFLFSEGFEAIVVRL